MTDSNIINVLNVVENIDNIDKVNDNDNIGNNLQHHKNERHANRSRLVAYTLVFVVKT